MNESARSYLDEIKKQSFFGDKDRVGSLKWNVAWYRKKATKSHNWFRSVGFLTVFLSVSLPFALTVWPETKQVVENVGGKEVIKDITQNPWLLSKTDMAAALSWLIALAGGANGFFQWGRTWQSRTEAYLRLERLFMEWEVAVHQATVTLDIVTNLTKKMVTEARETIKSETGAFFEEIQFPEVDAPEKPDASAE